MDDVLSRNDLRDDKNYVVLYIDSLLNTLLTFWQLFYVRYLQLQNRCLAFKKQLNSRTRPEERISANPDLTSSTQPLQRNTWLKTGSHLTKTWNRKFHRIIPPPPPKSLFRDSSYHSNHKNPSQAPKRKKPRIQIVNYLGDDNDAQGKQKRRARLKKSGAQPYKYSKGELRRWLIF